MKGFSPAFKSQQVYRQVESSLKVMEEVSALLHDTSDTPSLEGHLASHAYMGHVRFAYWIALFLRTWKRAEVPSQFLQDWK